MKEKNSQKYHASVPISAEKRATRTAKCNSMLALALFSRRAQTVTGAS
jgi:hypothetical protein